MTTIERHPMIPVAPPSLIENFYTPEEIETIFSVIRENGPWRLILAHHFSSTEEYLAISGGRDRKADAKLSDFVAPVFRGFLGNEGVVFHPELQDIYFGSKLLDTAKSLHGAKYGMVHNLLFNVCGPSHSFDAGHFDTAVFRGMGLFNTPIWLLAIMSKCGLFDEWESSRRRFSRTSTSPMWTAVSLTGPTVRTRTRHGSQHRSGTLRS